MQHQVRSAVCTTWRRAPAEDERWLAPAELCYDAGQVVVEPALEDEVIAGLRVTAHMRDQPDGPHVLAKDQQPDCGHAQPLRDVVHVWYGGGHGHVAHARDGQLRATGAAVSACMPARATQTCFALSRTARISRKLLTILMRLTTPASNALPRLSFSRCTSSMQTRAICDGGHSCICMSAQATSQDSSMERSRLSKEAHAAVVLVLARDSICAVVVVSRFKRTCAGCPRHACNKLQRAPNFSGVEQMMSVSASAATSAMSESPASRGTSQET